VAPHLLGQLCEQLARLRALLGVDTDIQPHLRPQRPNVFSIIGLHAGFGGPPQRPRTFQGYLQRGRQKTALMMEVSGQEEVEHCTIVFWTYYIVRAHCRLNENDSDKGVQGVLKLVLLMEVVSLSSRRKEEARRHL